MYIQPTRRYYDNAGQRIGRGYFLLLIQNKDDFVAPIKAVVRKVAMSQCGQFMMGYARVYGKTLIISGSYGNDGLPMQVDSEIYNKVKLELPQDLVSAWVNGSGWNGVGNEAQAMAKWANENLKELRG
jgi:hypothetical protein